MPERPEHNFGRLPCVSPDIIARETDILPAKRCQVGDNRRETGPLEFNKGRLQIARVPQDDEMIAAINRFRPEAR